MSDAHLTIYRAVKLNRVIQYLRSIAEVRRNTNDHFQYLDIEHLLANGFGGGRWAFGSGLSYLFPCFATARQVSACQAKGFGVGKLNASCS
jgi:hypothetical protein